MEPISPSQLMRKYDSLNLLPEDFQDPRDCEPMVNPFIHIACGKSAEEASIRECLEFNGRCVSCNEEATIEQFVVNRNLRSVLEEFPMKVLSVIDQQSENLRSKDQRIGVLEEENEHLFEENTGLKGRVTDLTGERDLEREEKLAAFEIAKSRGDTIDFLNQEMERLNIHQEPSIQEFIRGNLLSKRYTPEQWNKKLTALKQEAEYWLAGILQGRLFARVNAFISQGVSEDHEEKHREIVETLLTEIKQRVIALVRNKMHYYSTDLIDTFIIGEFQVRYNDAEFKEFLEPLMERLIAEDLLTNRLTAITKADNVSLQDLPKERWDEYEPNRWSAMTYKQTMESVLSYALEIELCTQLLASNIGR